MIRVMLVDDHEMVRMGLKTALELEDDIEVVAEADCGEAALATLQGLSVDVILMDVMMEGLGGIAACREIKESPHSPKVLMLTSSSDDRAVLSSMLAGANGYLLKNVQRQEILRCVRAVAQGERILDPAVADTVARQLKEISSGKFVPQKGDPAEEELSERELEVVGLIAEGKTNKEIAEALIIAEKTARNHVSRILGKLGLTRRSQAAAWAIRAGLGDS